MGAKTGAAIKEARTTAGFTQDALAKKVGSITASDISKAERGEKDLTQAVLKEIAKACGVTQSSLLNAEKASGKTGSAKTSSQKKSDSKKKTSKTDASEKTEVKLTAKEKELVTLYRKADAATKKQVLELLAEKNPLQELLGNEMISNLLGEALSNITSGKK